MFVRRKLTWVAETGRKDEPVKCRSMVMLVAACAVLIWGAPRERDEEA
jgi:hypothetical protein